MANVIEKEKLKLKGTDFYIEYLQEEIKYRVQQLLWEMEDLYNSLKKKSWQSSESKLEEIQSKNKELDELLLIHNKIKSEKTEGYEIETIFYNAYRLVKFSHNSLKEYK